MRNGINRAFSWLKKTLEITEVATVPSAILPDVRAVADLFGWERLETVELQQVNAAQPLVAVASLAVPAGVLRLVQNCSLSHTDTTVPHDVALSKRTNPINISIGLPTDRSLILPGQFVSLIGRTFLVENDFLIGTMLDVPVAGVFTLRMSFVDLAFGEYLTPV